MIRDGQYFVWMTKNDGVLMYNYADHTLYKIRNVHKHESAKSYKKTKLNEVVLRRGSYFQCWQMPIRFFVVHGMASISF